MGISVVFKAAQKSFKTHGYAQHTNTQNPIIKLSVQKTTSTGVYRRYKHYRQKNNNYKL